MENDEEYISIVLGPIGVGKSSFINSITKSKDCKTYDGPKIGTKKYNITRTVYNKSDYYFIDTPGFGEDFENEFFSKELKKAITEYPNIRCLIILIHFGEIRLPSSLINGIKKIKEFFPIKDILEHVIVVRTHAYKESHLFLKNKVACRESTKCLMNFIESGSNKDILDFINNKKIENMKEIEEYYVDCYEDEDVDIFEDNKEEFIKIFNKIKNTTPIKFY